MKLFNYAAINYLVITTWCLDSTEETSTTA